MELEEVPVLLRARVKNANSERLSGENAGCDFFDRTVLRRLTDARYLELLSYTAGQTNNLKHKPCARGRRRCYE